MKVKKFKVFLVLMLVMIMLFSYASGIVGSVSADTIEGESGDGVTFSFDDATGVLTFSGSGEITSDWQEKVTSFGSVVKSVEITGTGITSIGNSAFSDCDSLTTIEIPDGVTSIGDFAFYNCNNLTSIIIPKSVTNIGENAFCWCESLTSIEIPDGVTSIGNGTFICCISLTSITIPESVKSIGNSAFSDCDSLTTIEIPDGVTSIGNGAFINCDSLTTINIPDSVTSIEDSAFFNCYSLTTINIPDSVTNIEDSVFFNCYSLTSIIIPESVTNIEDSVFYGCDNLTIYCKPNSHAETYAQDNNIKCISDDTVPTIKLTQEGTYIIIEAIDNEGGAGLSKKAYSLNKTNWQESNKIKVPKTDEYTVYVKDNVGNIATSKIFIDLDAPTISDKKVEENKIIITAQDNVKLAEKPYSLDKENWQTSNEFTVEESKTYTIYVKDANENIVTTTIEVKLPTDDKTNQDGNKTEGTQDEEEIQDGDKTEGSEDNDKSKNENTNTEKEDKEDPTVSPRPHGQYGSEKTILIILSLSILSLILYFKYKKVKYIK